jgi:hypothetical protein
VKWFAAIYLTSQKKGISSIRLSKYLSITQKTAWFSLQHIREVMRLMEQMKSMRLILVVLKEINTQIRKEKIGKYDK